MDIDSKRSHFRYRVFYGNVGLINNYYTIADMQLCYSTLARYGHQISCINRGDEDQHNQQVHLDLTNGYAIPGMTWRPYQDSSIGRTLRIICGPSPSVQKTYWQNAR
jgi:hypothetical protein